MLEGLEGVFFLGIGLRHWRTTNVHLPSTAAVK